MGAGVKIVRFCSSSGKLIYNTETFVSRCEIHEEMLADATGKIILPEFGRRVE